MVPVERRGRVSIPSDPPIVRPAISPPPLWALQTGLLYQAFVAVWNLGLTPQMLVRGLGRRWGRKLVGLYVADR